MKNYEKITSLWVSFLLKACPIKPRTLTVVLRTFYVMTLLTSPASSLLPLVNLWNFLPGFVGGLVPTHAGAFRNRGYEVR